MRDFLFDVPWWMITLLGVVGVALFMSGNARQKKPVLRAGLGVLLFGALWALVSYLVDTPKERVIKGTHALVAAAVNRDKATLNAELHPNAALAGWKRQQIIDGAVALADQFGLKSATIIGTDLRQDDASSITETIRVIAQFQGKDLPYDNVPTDWQLSWWEMPDGRWLLKDITPMGNGNLTGQRMSKQFFNGS